VEGKDCCVFERVIVQLAIHLRLFMSASCKYLRGRMWSFWLYVLLTVWRDAACRRDQQCGGTPASCDVALQIGTHGCGECQRLLCLVFCDWDGIISANLDQSVLMRPWVIARLWPALQTQYFATFLWWHLQ
jgi:hypothetical protein